jgi:glutamyl-tRNA synthetase
MSEIRVRFAPSPTGFLHIGGARTALFNWLYARSQGGKFFLRIEDTDRSRSTDEAILAIIDGMSWLGLNWDQWEGSPNNPVRQTERLEIYKKKAVELLEKGLAYRCYCTAEELATRREEAMAKGRVPRYDGRCKAIVHPIEGEDYALRFAAPADGPIIIADIVKGQVTFEANVMDDLIILRSDGTPTYNFCVVVDDVEMQITHVIRGDDHLNNTPRQIGLYKAFGYAIPAFGHVSMILGADKTRLSKRHGATAVQQYREEGYLPSAMINYLVRLGWSFKDQEIFSAQELLETFSMDQVGASPAMFNPEKLLWINAHYIKTGDPKAIAELLLPHLHKIGLDTATIDCDRLERVVVVLRERSRTLVEMAESAAYFLRDEIVLDEKAMVVLEISALPILKSVLSALTPVSFEHDPLSIALKAVCARLELKLSQVAQPIRAAITGKTVSPGIFDVLMILGKEKSLVRLARQIERIEIGQQSTSP